MIPFTGKLVYTDPTGIEWQIIRKRSGNNDNYWHANEIGGERHFVSISVQRLLQTIDHPDKQFSKSKNNGK